MRRLTVLYDPRCRACASFRRWLAARPAYARLAFVPWRLAEAVRRFPALEPGPGHADLVVVGDGGEVWRGAKAWRMCVWSLRGGRTASTSAAWLLQARKEHDAAALPGPPPLPRRDEDPAPSYPWSTAALLVAAIAVGRWLCDLEASPAVIALVFLAVVVLTVLLIQGWLLAVAGPRPPARPHRTSHP